MNVIRITDPQLSCQTFYFIDINSLRNILFSNYYLQTVRHIVGSKIGNRTAFFLFLIELEVAFVSINPDENLPSGIYHSMNLANHSLHIITYQPYYFILSKQ